MATVTFTLLSTKWASQMNAAHDDNQVIVAEYWGTPVAVLISHDLWSIGQERAQAPAPYEELNSRAVPSSLRDIREKLGRGKHTVVTVDGEPKVAFARYDWAREVFQELGLPATPQDPECAMVVYRNARTVAELGQEFGDQADPDMAMDRRMSAGPARIPAIRRSLLRAMVYVHDGVVARVRAIDTRGEWEELPGPFSLVPVSEPLTAAEIDRRFPGLRIYPRDKRAPRWGLWREYVDL